MEREILRQTAMMIAAVPALPFIIIGIPALIFWLSEPPPREWRVSPIENTDWVIAVETSAVSGGTIQIVARDRRNNDRYILTRSNMDVMSAGSDVTINAPEHRIAIDVPPCVQGAASPISGWQIVYTHNQRGNCAGRPGRGS